MLVVVDNEVQLHFLMNFPLHLHINRVILLELLHHDFFVVLKDQLDLVLFEVGGGSLPADFLYQVIHRHIDGCASQSQPYYEAFRPDFLSSHIQKKIDETLHYKLLQSFSPAACLVDEVNFFFQLDDFVVFKLLIVDALL